MKNNTVFSKYKLLAIDIYEWCKKHNLWGDNTIYFDGIAWSNSPEWGGVKGREVAEGLYEYKDKNPRDYFEYANSETLSMSFEGSLNYILNGYIPGWVKLEDQFQKLFKKHGLYYEMGHAWNLAAYEL